MNLLPFFLAASLLFAKPEPLMIIDMNGKKPPQFASEFSTGQYMSRNFPIYTTDLAALIEATQKAARLIDHKPGCNSLDTVSANHTLVIVKTDCRDRRQVTVRLVSRIQEPQFLCDFELVRREEDERKAQRKLLEFVSYLSQ